MVAIGERLALLREALGVSQKQLADFLGVSEGAVGNWEIGYRTANLILLGRFTRAHEIPMDYLSSGSLNRVPMDVAERITRLSAERSLRRAREAEGGEVEGPSPAPRRGRPRRKRNGPVGG